MTSATPPRTPAGRSTTAERSEPRPAIRTVVPSGWYDPDGAGWEDETPPAIEALRSTPVRPGLRRDDADSDRGN